MLEFKEYREGAAGDLPQRLRDASVTGGNKVLVNYGNSGTHILNYPDETGRLVTGWDVILNEPKAVACCVDKVQMLQMLQTGVGRGYACPQIDREGRTVPCVVKRQNHRGGRGILIVQTLRGLDLACRRSGVYVEEYVPCVKEYRVHVVGDNTCARLKAGGTGEIRSRRHGWRFVYDPEVPQSVRTAAREAVKTLALDFGAVDVGYRDEQTPVVYEVNSAPNLSTDTVITWYAGRLAGLIERRLNEYGRGN